ncbi:two component transcriptional regulator winged helix family [Firmicutes bacterium CAG:882]|jgi:DNA-binding response OmpR family regulator|nr:two component transcriptional regulator winged helix family [Firmicutes bacterium CAG:882]
MTKILLVEDEETIVRSLKDFLRAEGFDVDNTDGQKNALEMLERSDYDLALLDVSLSEGNGFSLCSAIKKEKQLPVIFLTASGDEFSVVTGLDLGADDYIAKPFRPRELVSRINSVLRRCGKSRKFFDIDNVRVDLDKGVVYRDGQDLYLSALEYRLFLAFINSEGRLLTRSRLLEEIWDVAGDFVNDNTLTVYIKRLRDKIESNPAEPRIIVTVRGMGYKLGG